MSVLQDLTSHLIHEEHVDEPTLVLAMVDVHLLHSVWVALKCVAGHWLTVVV